MSESKKPLEFEIPVWGIILFFLGIVFLLQTLNIISWSVWGVLWRFWPVLIIIVGLSILLRKFNIWLVSGVILAILFACLGIALTQSGSIAAGTTVGSYAEPLAGFQRAQVEIKFDAGSLNVSSLPASSPDLVQADYDIRNGKPTLTSGISQRGNQARLNLTSSQENWRYWYEGGANWETRLTQRIPLALYLNSEAGNVKLDLNDLDITDLGLYLNTGNYEVMLPAGSGTTNVTVRSDVANVKITIPQQTAARVRLTDGLTLNGIDEDRFPRQGNYYVSPDYDRAENRLEIEINTSIGRVTVD